MDDDLAATLARLLRPGGPPNAALDALVADYRLYHLVLALVGSAFLFAALTLTVLAVRRVVRAPRHDGRRWTLERWVALAASAGSAGVAAFLALVVAANVSTVLRPLDGFAGALGLLRSPRPGSRAAHLQGAYTDWLASATSTPPPAIQAAVDGRLAWQRPKAVVCAAILILLATVLVLLWRAIVRRSRRSHRSRRTVGRSTLTTTVLLVSGIVTAAACALVMLMVMGNSQAAVAPLSMTMFYG